MIIKINKIIILDSPIKLLFLLAKRRAHDHIVSMTDRRQYFVNEFHSGYRGQKYTMLNTKTT